MSNEEAKLKNSSRRHRDDTAVKRQLKIAKAHGITNQNKQLEEPHRFSKHHAMNCGNPSCLFCSNPRKIFKEKTIQEKRFEQNINDE